MSYVKYTYAINDVSTIKQEQGQIIFDPKGNIYLDNDKDRILMGTTNSDSIKYDEKTTLKTKVDDTDTKISNINTNISNLTNNISTITENISTINKDIEQLDIRETGFTNINDFSYSNTNGKVDFVNGDDINIEVYREEGEEPSEDKLKVKINYNGNAGKISDAFTKISNGLQVATAAGEDTFAIVGGDNVFVDLNEETKVFTISSRGGGGSLNTDIIAETYNEEKTYEIGDYVVKDNKLYKKFADPIPVPSIDDYKYTAPSEICIMKDGNTLTVNPGHIYACYINIKNGSTEEKILVLVSDDENYAIESGVMVQSTSLASGWHGVKTYYSGSGFINDTLNLKEYPIETNPEENYSLLNNVFKYNDTISNNFAQFLIDISSTSTLAEGDNAWEEEWEEVRVMDEIGSGGGTGGLSSAITSISDGSNTINALGKTGVTFKGEGNTTVAVDSSDNTVTISSTGGGEPITIVDEVTKGNQNAVTSNAVAVALENQIPTEAEELDYDDTNTKIGKTNIQDAIEYAITNKGTSDVISKIKVGTKEISASGSTSVEFTGGENVSLSLDETNNTITISSTGGGSGPGTVVDVVEDGNPNAVSSNAVYDHVAALEIPTAAEDISYTNTELTDITNTAEAIDYLINKIKTLETALLLDGKTDNIDVTFEEDPIPIQEKIIDLIDNILWYYGGETTTTNSDGSLTVNGTAGGSFANSILWKADLTDFNKVLFNLKDTSKTYKNQEAVVGISNDDKVTGASDYELKQMITKFVNEPQTLELDISSFTGEHYLVITQGNTSEITISSIKLTI